MIRRRRHRLLAGWALALFVAGCAAEPLAHAASGPPAGDAVPGRFALTIDALRVEAETGNRVIAAFALPSETKTIAASELTSDADLVLQTGGQGVVERAGDRQWRWRAPEAPGLYRLRMHDRTHRTEMRINMFVKRPYDVDQRRVAGYRIGRYQPRGLRGRASSAPPPGLIEVTQANVDTRLSPHFTLAQFLCHQQPGHWPKYVLVHAKLLAKLERLHSALDDAGFSLDTLTVMSGYRTPWYNADIGNTTVYSQHLFGGAADIYIDADGDGRMDDLNADGLINTADARWLAALIETVTAKHPALAGGLSAYPANAAHGPFVHTDVRGVRARW